LVTRPSPVRGLGTGETLGAGRVSKGETGTALSVLVVRGVGLGEGEVLMQESAPNPEPGLGAGSVAAKSRLPAPVPVSGTALPAAKELRELPRFPSSCTSARQTCFTNGVQAPSLRGQHRLRLRAVERALRGEVFRRLHVQGAGCLGRMTSEIMGRLVCICGYPVHEAPWSARTTW